MEFEAMFGMLIGFGLVVVLPLVAVLTKHQRHMAELVRKDNSAPGQQNELVARLDLIQRQLEDLRNRQNEIIIHQHEHQSPPSSSIENRMQDGSS